MKSIPAKGIASRLITAALHSALLWASGLGSAEAGINEWTTNGPEAATINALAVDPRNPGTLYAAVGSDFYGFTRDARLFKSTDGGGRWQAVNGPGPGGAPVGALVIDPRMPTTLYAGTSDGLFKTSDGGVTWSHADAGLPNYHLTDLVIDPQTSATLYAVLYGEGIFKTTDGGGRWFAIARDTHFRRLVIDPQTPTTLYAGSWLYGVLRSADGGRTWGRLSVGPRWIHDLAIDPHTPSTLYAGTWCDGLFKSLDAGRSWSLTGLGGNFTCVTDLVIDPHTPTTLYAVAWDVVFKSADGGATWSRLGPSYADVRALTIDPQTPTTLYLGLAGDGVLKTTDGGGRWHAANSGLFRPAVSDLAVVCSIPTTVYAGTVSSRVFKSTSEGRSWNWAGTGMARQVRALAVDSQAPTTLYAGTKSGVFKSTDGGDTWLNTSIGIYDVRELVIDPQTPTTLYAGTSYFTAEGDQGGIFKTTDGGRTWISILYGGGVTGLVIDPGDPMILYAHTFNNRFGYRSFKTHDGGGRWSRVDSGLPECCIGALIVDPRTPTTRYALARGGVFKSIDGGDNWQTVNTGLAGLSVIALAMDPVTTTTLYASTYNAGVFKTTDGGGSWTVLDAVLTDPVWDLAIDPRTPSTLYAATRSGVFVLQQQDASELLAAVVAELDGWLAADPGAPLAHKVEHARDEARNALAGLAETPPERRGATGEIKGAVADLEVATGHDLLDPVKGNDLMDRLAVAARLLAKAAIEEAIAASGDPAVIVEAQQALEEGDGLRAAGAYKTAVNRYDHALLKAESA